VSGTSKKPATKPPDALRDREDFKRLQQPPASCGPSLVQRFPSRHRRAL